MAQKTQEIFVTGRSASRRITYTFTLRLTENTADPVAATTQVTVEAILRQSGTGTAFSNWRTGVSAQLNGETLFSQVARQTLSGPEELVLFTQTHTLTHNADGTCRVRLSGRLWQEETADFSPPEMTIPEATLELTPLPRPAEISAADAAIGAVSGVAIYPIREQLQYILSYRFGSLTGYLTQDGGSSDTPVTVTQPLLYWTVPEAFYSQLPDKKWDYCTLTCQTLSNGQTLGQRQCRFLVTAAEAACGPLLAPTVTVTDETTRRLTGGLALIRYHSRILCTPNAQPRHGARLTSVQVNGAALTGTKLALEQTDTGTFDFYVRDSRGWEASQTVSLPVILYEKPVVQITARRLEPGSPSVEVTATGRFYVCDFGLAENSLTLSYHIDGRNPISVPVTPQADGSFAATFLAENVDYTQASRLTVTAADRVTETDARLWVPAGSPVFHWDRDGFVFRVPVSAPSLSGAYLCCASALQSRFAAWGEPGESQPVWLWGTVDGQPVQGLLTVSGDGSLGWSGPEMEFAAGKAGRVTLPGSFVCLSPQPVTAV